MLYPLYIYHALLALTAVYGSTPSRPSRRMCTASKRSRDLTAYQNGSAVSRVLSPEKVKPVITAHKFPFPDHDLARQRCPCFPFSPVGRLTKPPPAAAAALRSHALRSHWHAPSSSDFESQSGETLCYCSSCTTINRASMFWGGQTSPKGGLQVTYNMERPRSEPALGGSTLATSP